MLKIVRRSKNKFIVVADHKLVLVTDVEDVAYETAEEMMYQDEYVDAECEHAYSEEMSEEDFDANGQYTTTEGDVITREDYNNAEHVMR